MKTLSIVFSVLFVVFLLSRCLFEFYVYKVPAFEPMLIYLTWLTVGFGVVATGLIVLQIIKEFKKK